MRKIEYLLIGLLACTITVCSCKKEDSKPGSSTEEPADSALENNKVIYELNVRNFSAAGNLAAVESRLDELQTLGVDIIWLMPIHPSGVKNRIGSLGSPYAVKDYKAISNDIGTMASLKSLVAAAHKKKMLIWMDWVANHTAWDHVWVTDHLDYYATNGSGVRPYSPNGWNDVIQLDYNNANMKAAMIDAMKYWVEEADIDGYRCDYASGVPLAFWKEARAAVNAIKPDFKWMAEAETASLMDAFDYDYTWSFNDAMNTFASTQNVTNLKNACLTLYNNSNYQNKGRMVFLTNHDLNAYSGTEFDRYGSFVLPMTVLEFTIYDMPLLYNGQEIGYNVTMGLFDYAKISWSPIPNLSMNNLIKKLTQLKRTTPALENGAGRGTLTFYPMSSANVLCYKRVKGDSEVLVMLNLSGNQVSTTFSGSAPTGTYTDYLSGGTKNVLSSGNYSLPASGYLIYVK